MKANNGMYQTGSKNFFKLSTLTPKNDCGHHNICIDTKCNHVMLELPKIKDWSGKLLCYRILCYWSMYKSAATLLNVKGKLSILAIQGAVNLPVFKV